jgi:hypothetical protein
MVEGLGAIAKKHKKSRTGKGTTLKPKAAKLSWGEWRKSHPTGNYSQYRKYLKATETPKRKAIRDRRAQP